MSTESEKLGIIESICERFGITSLEPQIAACHELLGTDSSFNVAVLGRFKAGKSSFLNSLSGQNILPAGVTPVTAAITYLKYAPSESITVKFGNGGKKKITADVLAEYISENVNPNNEKNVSAVEINLPSLGKYRGMRFVDTPGLDSVFLNNTDTSLRWLPNTGLAIMAISADTPLSKQDIDLLEQLALYAPRVLILVTKADRLSPSELTEVIAFIRQRLKGKFGRDFEIAPYSINPEFAAMCGEFEQSILAGLANNTESQRFEIIRHKLNSLKKQCSDYLHVALVAAQKAEAERQALKQLLENEKKQFALLREELSVLRRDMTGKNRSIIEERLKPYQKSLEIELTGAAHEKIESLGSRLSRMQQEYYGLLQDFFSRKGRQIAEKEKPLQEELCAKAHEAFTRLGEGFCARLSSEAEKVLGTPLPSIELPARLESLAKPDIHIDYTHRELIWALLPVFLFRKLVIGHFFKLLPFEVEKNLSRLTSQITEIVNQKISKDSHAVREQLVAYLQTVEHLMFQKTIMPDDIKAVMGEIEDRFSGK